MGNPSRRTLLKPVGLATISRDPEDLIASTSEGAVAKSWAVREQKGVQGDAGRTENGRCECKWAGLKNEVLDKWVRRRGRLCMKKCRVW